MDRKEILERKRQRLEELRKRREEINLLSARLGLPHLSPEVFTKVDFAVQVDFPDQPRSILTEVATLLLPKIINEHVQRFDKGIQTYNEESTSPTPDVKVPTPISESEATISPIDESQVQDESQDQDDPEKIKDIILSELSAMVPGFRFSDLRMGLKAVTEAKVEAKDPFNAASGLSGFLTRPISCIDVCSKFPELLLVAYKADGSRPKRSLAYLGTLLSVGLAIIFNASAEPFVPEFFLQCTSEITIIQFDKSNPYRIIGGLKNGRIAIWDLSHVEPSKLAVFPTLQTTTLASIVEKSKKIYIHHSAPIVSILQLSHSGHDSTIIVSISSDGVVNTWSPNFLAFPKLDSIKISSGNKRLKNGFSVNTALLVHHSQFFAGNDRLDQDPEYRFLNQLIVGSKSGVLQRLSNNKKKGNVSSIFSFVDDHIGVGIHSVSAIAEMPYSSTKSLLVSSHYDWKLRIWDLQNTSLVVAIPTSTIVTGIYPRPNNPHQIMTIGCVRPPDIGACIDFWDFLIKSMGPISGVILSKKNVQSLAAKFDSEGNRFIVSFDDGDIDFWDIEDSKLHSHIELSRKSGVDEALSDILKE